MPPTATMTARLRQKALPTAESSDSWMCSSWWSVIKSSGFAGELARSFGRQGEQARPRHVRSSAAGAAGFFGRRLAAFRREPRRPLPVQRIDDDAVGDPGGGRILLAGDLHGAVASVVVFLVLEMQFAVCFRLFLVAEQPVDRRQPIVRAEVFAVLREDVFELVGGLFEERRPLFTRFAVSEIVERLPEQCSHFI